MTESSPTQNLQLSNVGAASVAKLTGVIDESLHEDSFVGVTQPLVIDLQNVSRITSYGVRQWIRALKACTAPYVGFINVPECMITQFNIVGGFSGAGQLLSIFAPYVCTECGHGFQVLQDLRKDWVKVSAFMSSIAPCPACGKDAELDDNPESYYYFCSSSKQPSPPPEVQALLDGSASSGGGRTFKVNKHIVGTVTCFWITGELKDKTRFKNLADGIEGEVVVQAAGIETASDGGMTRFLEFLRSMPVDVYVVDLPGALIDMARPEIADAPHVHILAGTDATPTLIANYLAQFPEGPPNYVGGDSGSESVGGKYRILRKLGAGGMAEVFLAQLDGPGGFEKKLVLKRILPNLLGDPSFVRMFLQEARLAARISHVNVVQIFEVGHSANEFFIAMEYVRGVDLRGLLKSAAKDKEFVPLGIALKLMADISSGLYAAHSNTDDAGRITPIIHRDISPHNILVSRDGIGKLTDFGIAKASDIQSMTPASTLKGKLSYMAPEQATGGEAARVDHRVDIFSAGVVMYQLLTHVHPFLRSGDAATLYALLDTTANPPSSIRPELTPEVDAIVAKALARNPENRYASARLLLTDIETYMGRHGMMTSAQDVAAWVEKQFSRMRARGDFVDADGITTPSGVKEPREATQQTKNVGSASKRRPPGGES